MGTVIVEFSVIPVGTGGTSLSGYVAKAYEAIERSGVRHQLTPMGTVFEASSLEEALEVIKAAHEAVFEVGSRRVITSIKIDDRRDKERTMEGKVRSVNERLNKPDRHL
ncbi:MAG: MTH1187 family thiamine-binding protein [Candidatus Verstraetearchaeota archaeon]|nr:MTH1187 family thiamine-binding protein [Candidatus Verstraetearchaeota archaeon]